MVEIEQVVELDLFGRLIVKPQAPWRKVDFACPRLLLRASGKAKSMASLADYAYMFS